MKNALKPTHKICTKCKNERPIDEFNKLIRGRNGRRAQCKHCDKRYSEQRGLNIPQEGGEYKLNKTTMMNHMYIHFGWWESKMTAVERDQQRRDVRKYYKPEQKDKLK